MSRDKLRVAVLGAGNWTRLAHIPGWQRDPRSEVVAICDPRKERSDEFASALHIPTASDDGLPVVARPDVNANEVYTLGSSSRTVSSTSLTSSTATGRTRSSRTR